MTGMGGAPITLTNPLVVNLFHHGVYVTAVYWIIGVALAVILLAAIRGALNTFNVSTTGLSEPRSRTVLRMAFGAIWLFDGILQFQPSMPLGLATNVVQPMASGTPSWLHALMGSGIGIWNQHPIALAVGTAWIQVGIGLLLIVSNNIPGRIAAAVSVGWGTMIWLIGNGAGGIFSATSSILFGWPGATLFYVVAGGFLLLTNGQFERLFSVITNRFLGGLLLIGAVLQCLPSRGFWIGGNNNALTQMSTTMTQVAQPHALAKVVTWFGTLAGNMGGGFNIVVILWLVLTGVALFFANENAWDWPTWSLVIGAVFFWFIAEDAPLWGGLATDLNSLIPLAALSWAALSSRTARLPFERKLPREFRSSTGVVAASFATAMILYSIVLMGIAPFSQTEPTLFLAENGNVTATHVSAMKFNLTDQFGQPFSLGEHQGRYTLLTFLDPRCWTDCPLLAAQLKQVKNELSANAPVDVVAVAADPYHETLSDVNAFISKHQLTEFKNFYFVTGPLSATQSIWNGYGIQVSMKPTDKMSIHSDYVFLVSPKNEIVEVIPDNPLSSWSGENSAVQVMLNVLHNHGVK